MDQSPTTGAETGPSVLIPGLVSFLGLATLFALALMPLFLGEPPAETQWMLFVGRFHPVILHLPIGMIVLVVLQEAWLIVRRQPPTTLTLPIAAACISAVTAVVTGNLLASADPDFRGQALLRPHLLGGTAFAMTTVMLLICQVWSVALGGKRHVVRSVLATSCVVMTIASHEGASITHGSNYLTEHAPAWLQRILKPESKPPKQPTSPTTSTTAQPPEHATIYQALIQPILDRRCVQCHQERKAKGKLRLDHYEGLIAGGVEGPAVTPGNAEESLIIERMSLPEEDDLHMPPPGKPDATAQELALLKWWINQGASASQTISDVKPPVEILATPQAGGQ